MATPAPSPIRLDATALGPPRTLDDGTRVYQAILVYAGRPLQYGWGEEIPTPEALSDPSYLEGLHGISVVLQHPPGLRVEQGRAPRQGNGRRVGTVIEARFDPTEGEHGAVIVGMAVHEQADQREVERMRGVSEGYTPTTLGNRQISRRSNHIAITGSPRAEGAQIRVDEGGSMPDEAPHSDAFQKAYNDMIRRQDKLEKERDDAVKRADKLQAQLDEYDAAKADAEAKKADAEKERNDEIDRLANERAADLLKLQARADSLDVALPETAVTLADRKAALASALGCPEGVDPDAYIAGVEKARADSRPQRAADLFAASAKAQANRNDTVQWSI